MLKSPNDRRAIRTKKIIREVLCQLIDEKGFNDISITDLTTRADINRGTFYLHYNDKFDLLEQVENEFIQELYEYTKDNIFINFLNESSLNNPPPFMVKLFGYMKENAKFMKVLLGPNGSPSFQLKLKKLLEANLFQNKQINTLMKDKLLVPEAYFLSYVLSAHLGVLQQWLNSNMEVAPEELALILVKMFYLGPFKVSGLQNSIDK
jgi:AcrR family transcriptional regulator